MEPLLTIGEVATILRVSRSTAYRMKKEQRWPCILIGTQPRFDQDNLKQIIDMNRQTPPPVKTVPNVGTRSKRRNNK